MAESAVPAESGASMPKLEKSLGGKLGSERDGTETVSDKVQVVTTKSSVKAQQLLDQVLRWLSTASNEMLGACFAGLGAITYFILGRVGLLLIGVVAGVVLHHTWEDNVGESGVEVDSAKERIRRKREDGLDVIRRVLDTRGGIRGHGASMDSGRDNIEVKTTTKTNLDFSDFEPATGAALTGLTDAVIRDYVKWWYGPILPDDLSFPSACRQTLTGFLLSVSSHLSRKRPADVFLDFLTNSSSIVIVFLNELANGLAATTYDEEGAAQVVHQYLDQNPSSSLSNLLDRNQQKRKLRDVSDDILQSFLETKAYNFEPVKIFLRQILAHVCLEMTVQSCSKPEWINGWIVYLLDQAEPEIMKAIDPGLADVTGNQVINSAAPTSEPQDIAISPTEESAMAKNISHKRTVSRAEEAMDEAMQEAKRLSEMIAAEEAKRSWGSEDLASSGTTSGNGPTPTSSQSDSGAMVNGSRPNLSNEDVQELPAQQLLDSAPISTFTNFDQLLSSQPPTALQPGHTRNQSVVVPLTLHNANISIFDDSVPGDRSTLRSKPTVDYLLQVEPASSQHPGWMIARKYADFETLHEVLKRISVVSGVPEFADRHAAIPGWKSRGKEALRVDLEGYLRDALSFNRLAESEGMKRFLEKDQGLGQSSPSTKQGSFGFPTPAAFETMGKGMLDVLSAAPKGAAGGGKALLDGVTGVLGGVGSLGQKKQTSLGFNKSAQSSNTHLAQKERDKSWEVDACSDRISRDLSRASLSEVNRARTLPAQNDFESSRDQDASLAKDPSSLSAASQPTQANGLSRKSMSSLHSSAADVNGENGLHLPPPPSEIPDDWSTSLPLPRKLRAMDESISSTSPPPPTSTPSLPQHKALKPPLTEPETRVAVELFFATITSLYTLSSSVWAIRRTLLTAAKNFLLRPGNPNLEAIRVLIQDSAIDANISDSGLAGHIHKIRENALPTEAELKKWPPSIGEEEKVQLRAKARKLLVEKGMPQALTSVMGQAASGEAVGRLFDALQVEEVARGVMFALILQGVKAVTQ